MDVPITTFKKPVYIDTKRVKQMSGSNFSPIRFEEIDLIPGTVRSPMSNTWLNFAVNNPQALQQKLVKAKRNPLEVLDRKYEVKNRLT